jgi:hypothetical protein
LIFNFMWNTPSGRSKEQRGSLFKLNGTRPLLFPAAAAAADDDYWCKHKYHKGKNKSSLRY